MGVLEGELQALVKKWRFANKNITKFWWEVDRAAIKAVKHKVPVVLGNLLFTYERGILFIRLPSKRRLAYVRPRIELNKYGMEGITYEGVGEAKKWTRIETYGPKLVENIVQGISRDLLAFAMINLRDSGLDIVMHVHDEVVIEVNEKWDGVEDVCRLMEVAPNWAEGLPLRAMGYSCNYYRKE